MNEKRLISLIRYTAPLFIIIFSILITYFMTTIHKNNLNADKKENLEQYILDEKSRIKDNIDSISSYVEYEKKNSIKSLKKQLKTQVYMAYEIVDAIYQDNKDKKSKEEILLQVKSALKNLRFNNGRGYFFIYNIEGTNLFHPTNPELEGSNYYKDKDLLGKYGLKNLVKFEEITKEGFLLWDFLKPNGKEEYKKLGFTKIFEPYNWYIASGEYLDESIKETQNKILNNIRSLKYKNKGYIYVTDSKGVIIATKNKALEGKSVLDINKLRSVEEDLKRFLTSSSESMFIEYEIENENKETKEKIGYIRRIMGYNWVIGTGFNLDVIHKTIQERHANMERDYNINLNTLFATSVLLTLIFLSISYILSNNIENSFLNYRKEILKKEKEKADLRFNELRGILDNLPVMLAYKDTKNNVITVNKSSAQIMGKTVEELTNVPLKNIFPDDYKRYYMYDLEVIQTKKPKLSFIETHNVLGEEKVVEVSIVPVFNKKGDVENIIIFMIDITEKENLEKDNIKKEKLLYQQNKLATMGEMIGNIAHQWRQPLSTISTAATGIKLEKEMGILKEDEFYHGMDSINESVQYLSQTIEDFRNFFAPSKNISNEFNIIEPIEKTIKLINASFSSKDIKIIKDIENIKLISLETELVQVLINLLNNAKDALLTIKDEKRFVFISTYTKDDYLYIEVKDNGNGIKEEIIDRIFEPYFTTKHKAQGSGIGLYMSYEIVQKLLNGTMYAENETFVYNKKEYKGAKFTIQIKL